MTADVPDDSDTDELDALLGASARYALGGVDGDAFIRWFAGVLPLLCPDFASRFRGSEDERRAAYSALGRLLWNRLPLPDNQFRPRPLPEPERNAPCPCGSGRKYKHCCAHVESLPDPFEGMSPKGRPEGEYRSAQREGKPVSLLLYVLGQYPRTQLRKLPLAGLDLEEIGHIGDQWRRAGRALDAEALLERVFEAPDRLDARAQFAFDVLADCYSDLNRPQKKARLIERVAQVRDPTLRSAALHRRITILADRGDRTEAWRLFAEAQRHEPDNPMLATLELTLLMNEKAYERMRERGRFWIGRLARDRKHDYTDLIGHISELIADPTATMLRYDGDARPGLTDLQRMLAALPPVECHYAVEGDDGVAALAPSPALDALAAHWRTLTQVGKPVLTMLDAGDPDAWARVAPGIPWLARNPLAWQSFDVLDDLALAVQDANLMAGAQTLLEPLLARAHALLRLVLERGGIGAGALPWNFVQNRPALRLVVSLYYLRREEQRTDEALALARWLVTGLNPDDNHGLRAELVRLYLERGDAGTALEVCERYPDDGLVGTLFDRPLALFLLARHAEAGAALRDAHAARPNVLPLLVADSPKEPRSDGPYLEIGGQEEAWRYRRDHRALWEGSGALPWARGIVAESRRAHRR
ncbi:MAG: SEC-C domain-containing protein [Betaproteobacteria bacterium]|nr:SEC-C domain-containing protein [Betaproteobacteria bacterium]